jgi:CHAD domain-containing protein
MVMRFRPDSVKSAMAPYSKTQTASRAGRKKHHAPVPKLHASTACDTSFRIIARRYLADLTASHAATCRGDPAALHQMRIALTHLRTAILFFSPMVTEAAQARISAELKWLNAHLGTTRDLDVAIERLKAVDKRRPRAIPYFRPWTAKRANIHRRLTRALRSARYQRLVKNASDWIEHGSWSIRKGKEATRNRAAPILAYGVSKLKQWQERLLNKSRKLPRMDAERRHRLRLLNKKLSYSIASLEDLFPDKEFSRQRTSLKHLRKAQKSLGLLNDDARGHALAAALEQEGVQAPLQFPSHKREKRLIQTAAEAYRKLAALE